MVFKGGTAIRTFRAGNAGRFSTDLDFGSTDQPMAELLLETLDGHSLDGFGFRVEPLNNHLRSVLHIETPFGPPTVPARVECSPRQTMLDPEVLAAVPLPIHGQYSFEIPPVPVMRAEEAISEKLARYRRASLARDLYDLAWFSQHGPFNEDLVRRLTVEGIEMPCRRKSGIAP